MDQTSFTKAIELGCVDATQVRRARNSYNSKIPRVDFEAATKQAYIDLDNWANEIRASKFAQHKVIITTEIQCEDPTASLVVPGIYLVCTIKQASPAVRKSDGHRSAKQN